MNQADIKNIVDKAFLSFSGLIDVATLAKEAVTGFDFSTRDIVSDDTTKKVDLLYIDTTYDAEKRPLYRYVAKSEDFPDYTYSSLTIQGRVYKIEKLTRYQGVIELELR